MMKSMYSVLLILICNLNLSAQTSYIQVVSEPGISVFLDQVFKGKTTSDLGGLIIENVTPGNHIIKVVKESFNPQEESISIKTGEVYTYKVKPFIPGIKITQKGNVGQQSIDLQVGKLKIQSLPVSISIDIPKLGINSIKSQDEWNGSDIPAGEYNATFTWNNKSINYTIKVRANQLSFLFVNMIKNEIEDRSNLSDGTLNVLRASNLEFVYFLRLGRIENKIACLFTLRTVDSKPVGSKEIFLRLFDSSGNLLKENNNTKEFEVITNNGILSASGSRRVEIFDSDTVEMWIFVDLDPKIRSIEKNFKAEIYCDGNLIGKGDGELKQYHAKITRDN